MQFLWPVNITDSCAYLQYLFTKEKIRSNDYAFEVCRILCKLCAMKTWLWCVFLTLCIVLVSRRTSREFFSTTFYRL